MGDLAILTPDQLRTIALTKAQPVLGFTVYMEPSLAFHKEAVGRAVRAFLAIAEPHLNWYSDDKIAGVRSATPKLLHYPLKWLDAEDSDNEFAWFMWAASKDTDAPSYMLEGLSVTEADQDRYMSYLHVTFPIAAFSASFSGFADFVADFVSPLPVFYGQGGFVINQSLKAGESDESMPLVFAMAQRFIGLDAGEPDGMSITSKDGIKGVNWLTFINQGFAERVGGAEALRKKLSTAIVTRQLPSCLLIQAGPSPGIGDVNAGERLPLYREVARALKPIRAKVYPPVGRNERGSFNYEETTSWLARFDD